MACCILVGVGYRHLTAQESETAAIPALFEAVVTVWASREPVMLGVRNNWSSRVNGSLTGHLRGCARGPEDRAAEQQTSLRTEATNAE